MEIVGIYREEKYTWVCAKDMLVGDYLHKYDNNNYDIINDDEEYQTLNLNFDNADLEIHFDEYLYENFAWLLGVIYGDGHIGKTRIEISTGYDLDYQKLIVEMFRKCFCKKAIINNKEGVSGRVLINSKGILNYLKLKRFFKIR